MIYLAGSFIVLLFRRKSTAWFGMALLFFIPLTLATAMVINTFIFVVESDPWRDLCSDSLFHAEVMIGLVASAIVGIAITFEPSKRRTARSSATRLRNLVNNRGPKW